jgi:hypothetical protein
MTLENAVWFPVIHLIFRTLQTRSTLNCAYRLAARNIPEKTSFGQILKHVVGRFF